MTVEVIILKFRVFTSVFRFRKVSFLSKFRERSPKYFCKKIAVYASTWITSGGPENFEISRGLLYQDQILGFLKSFLALNVKDSKLKISQIRNFAPMAVLIQSRLSYALRKEYF